MNPTDKDQIQTFIETALRPAFNDIQASLASPERNITLIQRTENITEAAAAVVHQTHPATPYFTLTQSTLPTPQTQIVGSIYVEILQYRETAPICIGQYCLSIEIKNLPSAPIEISAIIGFTNVKSNDKKLETERRAFEDQHQRLEPEDIDDSDIATYFFDSFDTFERQLLASKMTRSETSETPPTAPEHPPNIHPSSDPVALRPIPEPIPISPPIPAPTPIPEAPSIPEALSILQKPPQLTFEEEKAETKKILAAQRQDVDRLLSYLKLTQRSFRDIWTPDLARGSALAQKIIPHRPEQKCDYQQAYDLLSAQATGFAWTFKPNMLGELANYFEVYWSMAELTSTFAATQANKPYKEAFIAQIQTFGEPDNLGQAKASITNPLRSLVRSISIKFGYPSEPGKICWIGFSNIETSLPVEQMIRLIQSENDQRRVLFETLSWGVLQVYQNAETLPKPEQNLGRNRVLSYLISAKQTIKEPTHPVEYELSNVEYLEFRFRRLIAEQERTWLATAQVRVTRSGGRVNLYGYGFEEGREPPQ